MRCSTFAPSSVLLSAAILLSSAAMAQEPKPGKLKIWVHPSEAYTFLDGKAVGPGHQSMEVAPGSHKVMVANYGFKLFDQDIDIQPGQTASVNANLEPYGDPVSGPRGRLQFEVGLWKAGDYAVFLNGKKPEYFVGHVDEFNNEIGPKQELIVPPGTYDVTVTRHGKVAWTGKVPVAANQRVVVHINDGHQVTKNWPRGAELGAMNRFKAGIATAGVVVAPVSGSISANPAKINCGQQAELKWASVETIDSEITHMSPVPREGQAMVSPRETTTYDLTAIGPGGVLKSSTTLELNPVVAQLEATKQKDTITLKWSTLNADSITLEPLGSVEPSGTRSVPAGERDETPTYTLHASNTCGGSEVKRASAHLTSAAEPKPASTVSTIVIKSIYFPTDYPRQADPSLGLVRSQQEELGNLAAEFTKYLENDPDAKLSVTGYADERGSSSYNKSLSERRAQRVKEFLVSKGIAEDKIETSAVGETQQLEKEAVNQLQTNNPNPTPEAHVKNPQTTWLAYNRRVDIILVPRNEAAVQSYPNQERFYPHQVPDSEILWQREKPDPKAVEQNK